ncbi:DUF350 domain-containing protein [Epidermidibacterium keratini]|uniref:DUF350 domain-containing protein n=1 Tax=Epidermidibacterium keratini TaxID=1891644 RepID=A0A7L4YQW5_9ACTN|nr:DUF350 domain-containing protein [Epidermidibacterium keratini]QHC01189.1 DUF350 domain-containing protein [Epidermidibacterium keratini]
MPLLYESLAALAYCGVGIAMMALGFVVVDLLTPGKLREQIWVERNRDAAILLASNILGVSIIVVAAIFASADALGAGLLTTVVYSIIGLVAMAVSFLLLDAMTPGKLGELMTSHEPHPAVWVSAAMHVGIGLVIAAALI